MLTIKEIHNYFQARGWKGRIITDRKNAKVLIKLEPENMPDAKKHFGCQCPEEIKLEYAPLTRWDRFRMGKFDVRLELR